MDIEIALGKEFKVTINFSLWNC